MANIDIASKTFSERQKEQGPFEHSFNVLNTSVSIPISQETFDTGHPLFADDIMRSPPGFNTSATDINNKLYRVRKWTPASQVANPTGGTVTPGTQNQRREALFSGSFVTTFPNGEDQTISQEPYIERIEMPLALITDSRNQSYFAFNWSGSIGNSNVILKDVTSANYNKETNAYPFSINKPFVKNNGDKRIRNWIHPERFGSGYAIGIFESNNLLTDYDTNFPVDANGVSADGVDIFTGFKFDPFAGALAFGIPGDSGSAGSEYLDIKRNDGLDELTIHNVPFWVVGYRYIGPTGEVPLATTASFALNAGAGGTGGGTGVSLFSNSASTAFQENASSSISTVYRGYYHDSTLFPSDGTPFTREDVTEYVVATNGLIITGSTGDQSYIALLGSSSYNTITKPIREGTDANSSYYELEGNRQIFNGGKLFAFGTGSTNNIPDLSSYGLFEVDDNGHTTHSFSFDRPVNLNRIGLYFSANDPRPPNDHTLPTIEKFELTASTTADFTDPVGIAELSNIQFMASESGDVKTTVYDVGDEGMPNLDIGGGQTLASSKTIAISVATASITDTTSYSYFKLFVSGGYEGGSGGTVQSLHHVELFENLQFGSSSRKQINVDFNQALSSKIINGSPVTEFDIIVSQSAARLGISGLDDDVSIFQGGNINESLRLNANDIQNVFAITSSQVTASSISTADIFISSSANMVSSSLTINSGSIILESQQPIYFTNKQVNGSEGVDEFSGRIFGHRTAGGVSDLYIDSYRTFAVSDAEIRLLTLNDISGSVNIFGNNIRLSGSVEIGGDGANVLTTGIITASKNSAGITGSSTLFLQEFNTGDAIRIVSESVSQIRTIQSIESNTSLTLNEPYTLNNVNHSSVFSDPDLLVVKNSAGKVEFKIGKSGNISASAAITGSSIFLDDAGGLDAGTGTNRSSFRGGQVSAPVVIASGPQGLTTTSITASSDISASGTITMLTASIGGGIFTSASLASGGNDTDLSAHALIANISGAFIAPSSSFSTRVTSLEGNFVASATGISGSFIAPSSSFSSRVTSLETNIDGGIF